MPESLGLQRSLHFFASSLTLIGQRLPFVKYLTPLVSSPVSLRVATPLTINFVGVHTLSGQSTTMVAPVPGFEDPAMAKVGEPFVWEFESVGAHTAQSYRVEGFDVIGGLEYEFGLVDPDSGRPFPGGSLSGTPEVEGNYQILITGYRFENLRGDFTETYTLTLVVEDDAVETPFLIWRETNWTASQAADEAISGAQADPDGDGIPNALEYFLDLNPLGKSVMPGALRTDPDDNSFFLYELPMNELATDAQFKFQRSVTLGENDWEDITMGEGTFEVMMEEAQVRLRFPKEERGFIRVVVSL